MRKVIVCNIMSLDGRFTGPDGDVMVMPMDHAFDAYNAERLRTADTLLAGRVTYLGLKGFWPPLADDPEATPIDQEVAQLNNAIDKVVVSDSLTSEQTEPWRNTGIVRRAEAHAQIAELKRRPGKDILIFGSHVLWNDLLVNGLVDELHLMIGAAVVGAGTPLFDGVPDVSLRLIDVRTWDGSDNVLVRYAVLHERPTPGSAPRYES